MLQLVGKAACQIHDGLPPGIAGLLPSAEALNFTSLIFVTQALVFLGALICKKMEVKAQVERVTENFLE